MDPDEINQAMLDLDALEQLGKRMADDAWNQIVQMDAPATHRLWLLRTFENRWKELRSGTTKPGS